jgi:hypothetical protein
MILKKVTFFSKRLYAFLLFFLTLEKPSILLLCTMYTYYIRDSFMVSLSLWFRWNAWQERTGSSVAGWRPTNPRDQRLGTSILLVKGLVSRDLWVIKSILFVYGLMFF